MCSSEAQGRPARSRVDEPLLWVVATRDLSSEGLAEGRDMLSGVGGEAHIVSFRRLVLTRGTNPPAGAGWVPLDAPRQRTVGVATADRTSRAVTEEGR